MRRRQVLYFLALGCFVSMAYGKVDSRSILTQHQVELSATKSGVDSDNHLWFWNAISRTVTRISERGELITSGALPTAISVDADTRRGILTLSENGLVVQVISWDGRVTSSTRLTNPAGDVAWMTGSEVAVTPQYANRRVEVWNLSAGTMVRVIGTTLPIPTGNVQILGRATLVRYNEWRDELIALDSTFGHVYVFASGGAPLREMRLPGPPAPVSDWLGAEHIQAVGSHTIFVWRYPTMSVTTDGAVLIGFYNKPAGTVTVYKYAPDNSVREIQVIGPECIRAHVVVWQDVMILFRNPNCDRPMCAAVAAYNELRDSTSIVVHQIGDASAVRTMPIFSMRPNASPSCAVTYQRTLYDKPPCSCATVSCPVFTCCRLSNNSCDETTNNKYCDLKCWYVNGC